MTGTELCAIAALMGLALPGQVGAPQATPQDRFTGLLDTLQTVAITEANPAYNGRPLTVELWGRLRDANSYNILVANELKRSPTHWEIFTMPRSGVIAAYLPGNRPPQFEGRTSVTDGQWHYVAMVLDGNSVRLYVDGKPEAGGDISRPPDLQPVVGQLVIGSLVSRDLSCNGEIAEVRISAAAREITAVPAGPLAADEATIGLWRLDRTDEAGRYPDLSRTANHAVAAPAIRTLDRVDITSLSAAEAGELHKARQKPSGRSRATGPPEVDLAATRKQFEAALAELSLPSLEDAEEIRDAVLADWEEQYFRLDLRLKGQEPLPKGAAEQVFDRNALVHETDGDPLGVVLRRTAALIDRLKRLPKVGDLSRLSGDFEALEAAAGKVELRDAARRRRYFLVACALRREIAFANPLLDFDRILFVARGNYLGSRVTGPTVTTDAYGQHFVTQYFAFSSIPGGGLFCVADWKTAPKVTDILAESVIENGRLKGGKLAPGAFLSPDLSYDGKTIVFAYTENREHKWVWSKGTTWNLFRVNVDGSGLRQLTDSEYNDFDPCWLPNGRIAFISERRGGYIRCFALLHVPNYVLHSMDVDGGDIYPLSYYETSEWHPSVNNDGMIVYTRWDYTDRENCLGSNFWICYPDGRDPRAPHGNYPYPWHTFEDNQHADSRIGRPYVELSIRAIPDSHRYILTAAPHHGEAFGALVMLDLREPDDGFMSQLRRITPYVPFPETEFPARSQYPFGTPWPLSEDFCLCNWWESLYLLDRFGNRELICENALVFGETNWDMRLIDPIPLRPRKVPPIIPAETNQGEDADPSAAPATIAVMNVYDSDLPFPEGTKIKWLRVIQNILKTTPWMGVPMIGYQNENAPRIPLGIVPVEEDGSAYLEAPVEKELIFQVLDEDFMAVQSMRSVAYVHPGEQLSCMGCHEPTQKSLKTPSRPTALERAPSRLQPEIGPVEPITYYRHVKPVFERSCVPCHRETGAEPIDMSYAALEPYAFYFAGGMSRTTVKPIHGGSRTIPGRFGARNSRIGRALLDENHRGKVADEDYRRIVLWLDSNSPRLGAYYDEEKQVAGEVVWPRLDVDPDDPVGVR
jgi:hypothetical protein